LTDAYGLHKPGYRYATDAAAFDAKQEAYAESVQRMCDGWKQTDAQPPAGAYPLSAGGGNPGTIDGRPGTFERRGDWLVSVANGASNNNSDAVPRTMDAATAQRIRDQAWEEMCQRQRDAWKAKP